jgi:hypothetical protein
VNHVQQMTVSGEVLVAGSAGYEPARRSQIARFDDVRPYAVVRCRVPEDVAQALAFARETTRNRAARRASLRRPLLRWTLVDDRRRHRSERHEQGIGL